MFQFLILAFFPLASCNHLLTSKSLLVFLETLCGSVALTVDVFMIEFDFDGLLVHVVPVLFVHLASSPERSLMPFVCGLLLHWSSHFSAAFSLRQGRETFGREGHQRRRKGTPLRKQITSTRSPQKYRNATNEQIGCGPASVGRDTGGRSEAPLLSICLRCFLTSVVSPAPFRCSSLDAGFLRMHFAPSSLHARVLTDIFIRRHRNKQHCRHVKNI